jgi:flagellar protein FliS
MNNQAASTTYQQASARGATPIGLIVSLFETILRDLRRAQAAFEAGNVETRVFELNHALTVIAHLQSVLDRQRGGEAAERFDRFYRVTRPLILEANIHPTAEALQNLLNLYNSVRQAWQEVAQKTSTRSQEALAAAMKTVADPQAVPHAANAADSAADTPRGNWSA